MIGSHAFVDPAAEFAAELAALRARITDLEIAAATPKISSGSNANGRWVRWPDGTQMCWHKVTLDHTNGLSSSTRLAGGWTYPIPFVAPGAVVSMDPPVHDSANFVGCSRTNMISWGPSQADSIAVNSLSIFFTGGVSTTDARVENIGVTAIGRWK